MAENGGDWLRTKMVQAPPPLFLLDKLTDRLEIRRVITKNLEEAPP